METCSSILALEIPWTEEPGGLQCEGVTRVRHNLMTKLPPDTFLVFTTWRVLLKSTRQRPEILIKFYSTQYIPTTTWPKISTVPKLGTPKLQQPRQRGLLLFTQSCPTLCEPKNAVLKPSLSIIISWSLLKLMFIALVMLSNHLILCCPFSSCSQPFPALGSFPGSVLFYNNSQFPRSKPYLFEYQVLIS